MSTVEDVLMTKGPDVLVASPDDTVFEAARVMAQGKVGSVVVKEGDAIVGIFTERDLLCRVVAKAKNPAEVTLADVMTCPVRTCQLSDSVQTCVDIFAEERIRHLAVVDGGVLVGLVSVRDVLIPPPAQG